MRRDETTTPSDLDRPDGNGLQANYDKHDVGEAAFRARCEELGLEVEPWGIDMRGEDGSDGVIFDDAMDFKVYREVSKGVGVTERELVALVDVKTKSSPRWMGRFNLRHYEHYQDHAEEFHVPAFVVMMQVDSDTAVVNDEFVFHIREGADQILNSRDHEAVRTFPDGNHCALVKHDYRRQWEHFVGQVMT